MISFDHENIWLGETSSNKRSFLSRIYVNDVGSDIDNVILYSDNSRYIVLTFDAPECLPFDTSEEKLVFPINLNGISIQKKSGEKIDLFDEIMIFARL